MVTRQSVEALLAVVQCPAPKAEGRPPTLSLDRKVPPQDELLGVRI